MQLTTPNEGGARCVADQLCGGCDDRTACRQGDQPESPADRVWVGGSGRAVPLPPREDAARQVLGQERVRTVVAPVAVDVEVAAQQSLGREAQSLDQALARQVLRPDVG